MPAVPPRHAAWIALGVLILSACGTAAEEGPYDPDWAASVAPASSKTDPLFDELALLRLSREATGHVGGNVTEVFGLRLTAGDKFSVDMTVVSGDLQPHLSAFVEGTTHLPAEAWSHEGNMLHKEFTAPSTGLYVLAARAYHNEGEGDFTLLVTCGPGVCAGAPPMAAENLTAGEAAACIKTARECAFASLPAFGGAVGPARAETLFNDCLTAATTPEHESCALACDWIDPTSVRDNAKAHCKGVIEALRFYADQSAECVKELNNCMGDCANGDVDGADEDQFQTTIEDRCFADGFHGSCDTYARSITACGGTVIASSAAACVTYCESTYGARNDSLGTVCTVDAGCADQCNVDFAAASAQCGDPSAATRGCFDTWLAEQGSDLCSDYFTAQFAAR